MGKNKTSTEAEFRSEVVKYPKNMNLYSPNLSTWHQFGIFQTRDVLDCMVREGLLKKVKTLRYNGEILSEFTIDSDSEFNWSEIQDPEDFMPVDKNECEIIHCYRVVKSNGAKDKMMSDYVESNTENHLEDIEGDDFED